jgi:hypothetical protein
MSASWNKHVPNLPFIPPELWLVILQISTWVPGVLEPDIYLTSDEPRRVVTRQQQRLLKDSLVTKRYIVRVCKQWRTMATPFLYESIIIGRGRTLSSLCSALVDSRRKTNHSSPDHHPLGWYTKRLDVAMRDQGHHSAASELDFLAEAIRCLPNLTITMFSVRAPRYVKHPMPASIMNALADTCGPSLRVVDFSESVLHPFRHDWRTLLTAAPHLRILRGPETTPVSLDNIKPPDNLPFLSELTALVLASPNSKEYLTEENHFPSLREFEFHCFFPPLWDTWAGPLGVFGHNLTMVHLNFNVAPAYLQGEMNVLSEHCPNLTRLILSLKVWEQLIDRLVLPSVPYLALRCWQYQAPSAVYRSLFSSLSTMFGPTLQTVRLCDHHNVTDLRVRHARVLAQGLEQISCCSFRLEDHEGQLFT